MTPLEILQKVRPILALALTRVDEAIRRGTPPKDAEDLRRGKTPAAIGRLLGRVEHPLRTQEVHEALVLAGREVSYDAVAQALVRLTKQGKVVRLPAGGYVKGST